MEVPMEKRLNTKEAAQYLTDHGKPTEKTSLDTKRSTGGGPAFYSDGESIEYDTDDLDEYIKATPMVKYRSTSEYPPELRQKRKPKNGEGE
jgi:hypothetical protein